LDGCGAFIDVATSVLSRRLVPTQRENMNRHAYSIVSGEKKKRKEKHFHSTIHPVAAPRPSHPNENNPHTFGFIYVNSTEM
jgi:hypothetical protein